MKQFLLFTLIIILIYGCTGVTDLPELEPDSNSEIQGKTFGGSGNDEAYFIELTSDGGYIVVGSTTSLGAGGKDVYLLKLNPSLEIEWEKTFGGIDDDEAYSVFQTSDNGFILSGWTKSFGSGDKDIYLIKTDDQGNELWQKTYGGTAFDSSDSVIELSDGGYVIAGTTSSFGSGLKDIYLIKLDPSGNQLWSKTYGGAGDDSARRVIQLQSAEYIILGNTESFGAGNKDVYLLKLDALGNQIWSKTYGGASAEDGHSIIASESGGFVINGVTEAFGAGSFDFYLVKTDFSGNEIYSKTYGGTGIDFGFSIQALNDSYFLSGLSYSDGSNGKVYLIKTDLSGNEIFNKRFGGDRENMGNCIKRTLDGKLIIAGITESYGAGGKDIYILKIDSNGNVE